MKKQNYELEVLVNGTPLREYYNQGKHYIEGKRDSEFSIKIRNNGYKRILAVASVDGLSVMDGKTASHKSRGYIIDGYDSLVIDGWRTSDKNVSRFYFTNPSDSYAKRKNNGDNLGVVGVVIFREKDKPVPEIKYNFIACDGFCQHNHCVHCTCSKCNKWQSYYHHPYNEISIGTANSGITLTAASSLSVQATSSHGEVNFTSQDLGTGWGEEKRSEVTTISFEKEDHEDAVLQIFYNTREQLKKMGIEFHKAVYTTPNPFPGGYCEPPK